MPIVAGIGGNSGNQTITMIVRAVALGQVTREHANKLFRKEVQVALLNGLVWGGVMGLVAMLLYKDVPARAGDGGGDDAQPAARGDDGRADPDDDDPLGRDPAVGSSVLITAVTDSGGFFIFLGLATLFLIRG